MIFVFWFRMARSKCIQKHHKKFAMIVERDENR
jgi:hypothetical protein